jgi:hypothetical protein
MPLRAGRTPLDIEQGTANLHNRLSAWIGIANSGGEMGWTTDQARGDATGVPYPTTTPPNASDGFTQQRPLRTPARHSTWPTVTVNRLTYALSMSAGRSARPAPRSGGTSMRRPEQLYPLRPAGSSRPAGDVISR